MIAVHRLLRAVASAVLAYGTAAAGWSDDPEGAGRAASVTYRAVPDGTPIAVQPLDNAPLNLKIAEQLKMALRERGMAIAGDAPLLLEFETATEETAAAPLRVPSVEPRHVDIGRKRDLGRSDAVDARVDVYSNTRSSLLTGVRKPDRGLRYVLRATLADRGGPRLWEGYAEYGEAASSDERLFAAMAPLLAGMVGRTTGERRFRAR